MSSYFDTSGDRTLEDPELRKCPHCGSQMLKWYTPPMLTWGTPYQYVCFNDDCEYYQRGWKHMQENYSVTASYRYRFNPENGASGPLPVWSKNAGRGNIVDDSYEVEP